jgi:predicted aminopeptidase
MARTRKSGTLLAGCRRTAAAPILALAVSGCSTGAYYVQAIGGQLDLWRRAEPIAAVRAADTLPPNVRHKLGDALVMREFASRELGLPDNGSYRKYADIGRPYVVWSVFAAPALSEKLKEWCFPVAGCVGYRGYFARADADDYAAQLRRDGYDVHVTGVPAYSTLGWFDDPVLSSFIHYPETELARLIFHELAHQEFYLRGDSEFNESFATAVETVGVERWLAHDGDAAKRAAHERAQGYRRDFSALVLKYRHQLELLYASDRTPPDKLREKAQTLSRLKDEYQRLKQVDWGGFAGYDRWFGQDINNATLASIGIYTQWVAAFRALLAQNDDDLPRFYAVVKALGALPKDRRQARLEQLLHQFAAEESAAGAGARNRGVVPCGRGPGRAVDEPGSAAGSAPTPGLRSVANQVTP